ncbi:PAR1 [Artemisia annua]|uniref:PAR1 n=1 Tax=Artemisia annua TaxID=35608 RepID=A0A2U1PWP0_ARTAN|nr:PAR1 [Artemisia annua]
MAFILFILLSFLLQGALGELVCEELSTGLCTFSIGSSGKRCLLENYVDDNGNMEYQCRTSEIVVKSMNGFIESDECMNACGVHRKSVGISSDSLLEPHFIAKLCSRLCYNNCPNIVDLYQNIAIGEDLCKYKGILPRRASGLIF